jgi:hypothetical protein
MAGVGQFLSLADTRTDGSAAPIPAVRGTAIEPPESTHNGREDNEHPRQVVVNALWRRGLKPQVTRNGTIRYQSGLKTRDGGTSVAPIPFSSAVERYD